MRERMRLEWSAYAMADRIAIFDYIEADGPQAAIAVDERIREQVETLTRFPQSGRPGRIEGTRELVISRTPYVVAYRISGNTVRILRVLHGSRRWPDDMSEGPS
jgi:toxin ParE1/3/4